MTKTSIQIGTDGFAVPLEIMTSTTGIFGLRGSGKTNLAGVLAEGIVKAGQPLCVIDPTGSWFGMKSSRDGKSAGLPVYVFGGEHADVPLEPTAGAVLADFMVDQRVPTILDLSLMRKGEMRRFMIAFAENLFHKNRQPLAVMIDETPIFAPQTIRGGDVEASRCLGAVEDLATLARRKGVGVVAIAQRPALVNTTLRTQFENLIVLRTIGKHDRVAIDEWVEAKGSKQERDIMMADLASLPNGTGYFWSPGFLGEFRKVPFRLRETFDSSKTPRVGEKIVNPKVFAEIDKAKLSQEIAATVEKAKAEDPKEIRKRYEARLADQAKRIREFERAPQIKPADPEAEQQRLQSAVEKAVKPALDAQKKHFQSQVQEFSKGVRELIDRTFSANGFHPPAIEIPKMRQGDNVKPIPRHVPQPMPSGITGLKLPKAERSILTALAQFGPVSKVRAAIICGYAHSGGGFNNALGALRTAGFIESTADTLAITEAGQEALGSYTPLPTGPELLQYWLSRMPKAERTILHTLTYAARISKAELAEKCGYAETGGGFNNALGKLRTLELIQGKSEISLSEELQ